MQTPIQLIVGLGNPGPRYQDTRHNAGQWFVERLARDHGKTLLAEPKFHGLFAKIPLGNNTVGLLIPTTFMNNSGQSVGAVANFFKIPPAAILVAHDELDLPSGVLKLKKEGGHGGHNGLRDIINHLGTQNFPRLRVGISHPGHKDLVLNYVLGNPSKGEKQQIDTAIEDFSLHLPALLAGDWDKVTQTLHTKK